MTQALHSGNKQIGTDLHIHDNKYHQIIPKNYLCIQTKSCFKFICEWSQSFELFDIARIDKSHFYVPYTDIY